MALALHDRVQETTTTAGTGSLTLLGAVDGFQSFAVVGDTNTCYYTIVDGTAWEVGIGTYSTTGPTLARTTILSNSNADTSPITLSSSANTKTVFLTYPAEKSVNLDASGNVSPLGTIASGTWQGSTVGVAYGGTGVTASSGPNSVVLRDGFGNITGFNNFVVGSAFTTTSGGTTVLTDASAQIQAFVGSSTQTVQLPQATTLSVGQYFSISNNSTGLLTVTDNASTTLTTIGQGGAAQVLCTNNSTSAGTWAIRVFASSNTTWSNATLDYNGKITSATWEGDTVQPGYGGTGLTGFTGANNALYSTGATTLTAGTLPIAAGGTGNTTASAAFNALSPITTDGDLIIGNGSNSATRLPIGANGTVLTSDGTTATWQSSGGATYSRTSFVATAGQTTFSVSYTVGYVEVYLNGVLLNADDYTASNGTSIVLASAAALNDVVECVAFNTITTVVTTADDLSGGTAGQIVYQVGPNATGFVTNGTAGQALFSDGANAPYWDDIPLIPYPSAGIAVSTGSAWGTSLTAPSGAVVGTTDTQTLSNKTITGTKETVFTITDTAGFQIDPANGGIQMVTLGANRTPAATNFTAGQSVTLLINDGASYTITWTTVNPTWVGGSAPTLATTGYTVIELWKVGTTIYGAYVGAVA